MFWMTMSECSKGRRSEISRISALAATLTCALRSSGAEFDDATVSVDDGSLVIEGHVRTSEERRRAGDLAASIVGFEHVRNHLLLLDPAVALVEGGWLISDKPNSTNQSSSDDCFDWSKLLPINVDPSAQRLA